MVKVVTSARYESEERLLHVGGTSHANGCYKTRVRVSLKVVINEPYESP